MSLKGRNRYSRDGILIDFIRIIDNMIGDWEIGFEGKIELETYLVADLLFTSIKLVQLAAAIEEHFNYNNFPFQELIMRDDQIVNDLMVSDVVDFLYANLCSH